MICVRIGDGLGNQLFNYAFGYAMARKYDEKLKLDVSSFDEAGSREYKLEKFSVSFREHEKWSNRSGFSKVVKFIIRRIKYITHKERKPYVYSEPDFIKGSNNYYTGWWQSEKYFKEYASEIKREFQPLVRMSSIRDKYSLDEDAVAISVHIRRGDYVRINGCIDWKYYQDAISMMRTKFQKIRFFVFSDDIEYCKKKITGGGIQVDFIEDNQLTDLDEFFLMSSCDHHIIANSTFSWWAAYLNPSNTKIVIAPAVECWRGDFYPDTWFEIETEIQK